MTSSTKYPIFGKPFLLPVPEKEEFLLKTVIPIMLYIYAFFFEIHYSESLIRCQQTISTYITLPSESQPYMKIVCMSIIYVYNYLSLNMIHLN